MTINRKCKKKRLTIIIGLIIFIPCCFFLKSYLKYKEEIDDVNTLIKDYNITDALMLYNTNTFFSDESILNISDYE